MCYKPTPQKVAFGFPLIGSATAESADHKQDLSSGGRRDPDYCLK